MSAGGEATYRLVQRRGSAVAHAVPGTGPYSSTLCHQNAAGHQAWQVKPGELPLCKRCAKKLAERAR